MACLGLFMNSGCVTSAETILLEQQSSEEFMNQIKEEGRAVVVSISPQSIAALAAHFGLPPSEVSMNDLTSS